ncbi:MAG: carbohydrate kinase family protein [Carboxylicivirga sp.]|jgi:sugar/nucleoside kinase (ribokinase family)|nr:carbohydrate kinase family protein [Carboxylicivirga sp.]
MDKVDIIVAGDCNIDLIFNNFNKLPGFGEEVLADHFDVVLGSSAGITAAHLARLGLKVAYIGAIGNDSLGEQFKAMLDNYGVYTDYLVIKENFKTGVTVVMSKGEERANITHAGAMANLRPDDIPDQLIKNSTHFHLSNPYVLPNFRNKLPEFFKNIKSLGTSTSLDPQWDVDEKWDTQLKDLVPHLDVFFPNETELELLLKGNNMSLQQLLNINNHTIANTLGSEGVRLINHKEIKTYNTYYNANPVDCIGAGDAFTAGYLTGLIEKLPHEQIIELACKNAALSTTVAGGAVSYDSRDDFNVKFNNSGLSDRKR